MMEQELTDMIALVTGGSRGIGEAISLALAEGGATVAVVGRDAERAADAAAALPGDGHRGYACDVAVADQVRDVVARVEDELGGIDILVNNAGITRDNILLRMKDEEFDDVIATNLRGPFLFTRAVTRGMMKRRSGAILNITSVVGNIGNPGQANYVASKAGLAGMTKSVAKELASRGIRCNALAPGFIRTDMTDSLTEAQVDALRAAIPLGSLGTPEDVSSVARFLVGPGARYITGQILTVDGGMAM